MRTIRNYKTVENCLKRNWNEYIYWYGRRSTGAWFLTSPYLNSSIKSKPCKIIYNEFHNSWNMEVK